MHVFWAIVIGFFAGLIARALMPGKDPGGLLVTTLLGIVGAIIASYAGQLAGFYHEGEGAGFIGAIVGAMSLLFVYRLLRKQPAVS
jgi:uncharacterized membrane protein YeaQ/YmgE (transglycosylase-associated protein family)